MSTPIITIVRVSRANLLNPDGTWTPGAGSEIFGIECSAHGYYIVADPNMCPTCVRYAEQDMFAWLSAARYAVMRRRPDYAYTRDGHSGSPNNVHVYRRDHASPTGVSLMGSVRRTPGVRARMANALPPVRYGEHR